MQFTKLLYGLKARVRRTTARFHENITCLRNARSDALTGFFIPYKITAMIHSAQDGSAFFSVTQLTNLIKEMIEGSFGTVVVEGEISNCKLTSAGHIYLTLKDSGAQLGAAMWRSATPSLSFSPKDGMLVRCTGRLTVYPPHGKYQLVISRMEIAGAGNILQMLEERKKRLAAEGLFDESHKRPLPLFPKTVGIVTSATGAALRDILQIMKRRNPCVSAVILPATVQGEGAAQTIVRQITAANYFHLCDVLIVGRGGGSLEDLLPFSDEKVVRAVYDSDIPVISAVGHEIDWALSDYAADFRAPTPSAAAEAAVPLKSDIVRTLQTYADTFYTEIKRKVENMKLVVRTFDPENLELQFRNIEQPLLARFDGAKVALLQNIDEKLKEAKHRIEVCTHVLEGASPEKIFARGYSMVRDIKSGEVVRDASRIAVGAELEIVPAKGELTATVKSVRKEAKRIIN